MRRPVRGGSAPVCVTPLRAAYSGDSLWVSVFGAGKVARVDPSTAAVTQQVEVGPEPAGITDGFGSYWASVRTLSNS